MSMSLRCLTLSLRQHFHQRTRSVSRIHGASQQEAMANILQVDKEASMF